MRKARAYFGLDGSANRQDWLHAMLEVGPPLLVSAVVGWLDGVEGVTGWGLCVAYYVAVVAVWWPALALVASWRRPH